MACNFNCLVETEGLLKVKDSHMRCTCDNISERVQDRTLIVPTTKRKWYLAYRIAAIPKTLNDLQGHLLQAFSNEISRIVVISTDIARRAVPLVFSFTMGY